MSVAEFIEKLQALPQDATVYIEDWNEDYVDPTSSFNVEFREQTFYPNNGKDRVVLPGVFIG